MVRVPRAVPGMGGAALAGAQSAAAETRKLHGSPECRGSGARAGKPLSSDPQSFGDFWSPGLKCKSQVRNMGQIPTSASGSLRCALAPTQRAEDALAGERCPCRDAQLVPGLELGFKKTNQ